MSHESRINKLVDWCDEQGIENTNELTGRDLYEYRIWRRNDGDLAKTSEKTQMTTIRVFVQFLESSEAAITHLVAQEMERADARVHIEQLLLKGYLYEVDDELRIPPRS